MDLDAAAHNFRGLAKWVAPARAAAVVKADAYGLGVERLAPVFARAGARDFFVASPGEGVQARLILTNAGFSGSRIFVLHGLETREPELLIARNLVPVLNHAAELRSWLEAGDHPFALHVDTGMNRLGFSPDDIGAAADLCRRSGRSPDLLVSHFSAADENGSPENARQLTLFSGIRALFPGVPVSLANSAAAIEIPESHGDMVRLGLALYGAEPLAPRPDRIGLRCVATLHAPIIGRRRLTRGARVGYGGTFTAPADMEVATVALGYSDGFLRAGSPAGYAALRGQRVPILGRVSMDLTVVDVSACAGEASLGTMVEFLGPHIRVEDVARAAGTIPYEVLTSLGAQCFRVYAATGNGEA